MAADKIKTVTEVVQSIPDGAHVALGGFAINRCNIVVSHELIRQGKKNLTLSQGVVGLDTDLLVGAGLVERCIMGGGSLDRFGPAHCINRARERQPGWSHDYSSLTICLKYLAGAMGLSFMPTKCLLSSEVLERLEEFAPEDVKRMKCPFTGEEYLLLRALTPDISFVHVQVADREGNSQISGARWENEEQAKAAKRLVVVAEELVPTEYIQRNPERTIIQGHRVEAVIHQQFGAYPTACFEYYDFDADHLRHYVSQAKKEETFPEYVDEYILGTKDHWEYLEKAGGLRRMNLIRAEKLLGY